MKLDKLLLTDNLPLIFTYESVFMFELNKDGFNGESLFWSFIVKKWFCLIFDKKSSFIVVFDSNEKSSFSSFSIGTKIFVVSLCSADFRDLLKSFSWLDSGESVAVANEGDFDLFFTRSKSLLNRYLLNFFSKHIS